MNARVSYSFQRFSYGACPARSRGNPMISLWLSVDPLAGEYPSMSPYNYTAGNPINLVDPDRRGIFKAIGNIFKRIYNGIYNVFVSCPSQKRYVHKTIREAWAEPEFPLTLIQKLRRPKPYRRPYHKVWRQPVSALNLPSIEAIDNEISISNVHLNSINSETSELKFSYSSNIVTPTSSKFINGKLVEMHVGLPVDKTSLDELNSLATLLNSNKNLKIMILFPHQNEGYPEYMLQHLKERNEMEFEVLAKYLMKLGVSSNQLYWGIYHTHIKNPMDKKGKKLPLWIKIY